MAVPDGFEFHWRLGRAMQRSGRDPEPLARYLRDLILGSNISSSYARAVYNADTMKFQEFSDYSGPTGLFVATGSKIIELSSAEGLAAVGQSAMLTSLGSTPYADEYAAKITESLDSAHALELAVAEQPHF